MRTAVKQWTAGVVLSLLVIGCAAKETGPLLSHGQPVSYWIQELKSPDPQARKKAVMALGHVGTLDPEVVPALASAVKDRDATVRAEAVLALLNLGPAAAEAIPALTAAQKDRDPKVRSYAAKALQRIRGGT